MPLHGSQITLLFWVVIRGDHGSGLCPTRDRPDQVGWTICRLAADQSNSQVSSDGSLLEHGRVFDWSRIWLKLVGSSRNLTNLAKNRLWMASRISTRSNWENLQTVKMTGRLKLKLGLDPRTHQLIHWNRVWYLGNRHRPIIGVGSDGFQIGSVKIAGGLG